MSKYVGFRLGKVHESHVISEYYCGGCGWPVTDHDSFCPECGGAFRECDASNLEAENAKLRKELEVVGTAAYLYGRDDLKAENAKLRELMSVMAYCNQFRRDCDGCSMNGAAGIITERAGCDELLARLRELGVEVD